MNFSGSKDSSTWPRKRRHRSRTIKSTNLDKIIYNTRQKKRKKKKKGKFYNPEN